MTFEVRPQGGQQVPHGEGLTVEDVVLDGRQGVGDRAQADALDVVGVVAGAAVVVVLAAGDAVVDQDRQERGGHVRRVQTLDDVVAAHLDVDQVVELPAVGLEKLLEAAELLGVARRETDLLARPRVHAVVQGQFQHLGQTEVAGQDVGFLAEGPDLDAAAGAAVAGIGDGFAHADQLLDDQVRVEDRGLAEAGADDLGRPLDEPVRVLLADLDRRAGLHEAHLLDHVENEVSHLVDAVGAILAGGRRY